MPYIDVLTFIIVLIFLLIFLSLLQQARAVKSKGRGMLEGGRKDITSGEQKIRDGRRMAAKGNLYLALSLILLVIFGMIVWQIIDVQLVAH